MKVIADLEVHSKYARAVSPQMNIPTIALWVKKKGIDLVGTGDFTHPLWLRELESNLEEVGGGIYGFNDAKFLLTSEISCIYSHKGKGRRVHVLIYLPSLDSVKKFNSELTKRGANLFSDGRPIIGLSLHDVAQIALTVEPKAIIIPAHVWTPWFGFYGTNSGYDHLEEAFGELEKHIPAMETGLSSDPAMNWRIAELTDRQIVSFSDAHSPPKLGREATVLEVAKLSFDEIRKLNVAYTVEFYPEEGKYHYTGHRKCNVVYSPNEARKKGLTCPVCGKNLTIGVMGRVEHLASIEIETKSAIDKFGVRWIRQKEDKRPPYVMLVPLLEILAEALGSGVGSQKVSENYELLVNSCGNEFRVLLETPVGEIEKLSGPRVAEAISKVRSGDIAIEPGYDGVFGKVKIWKTSELLAPENPALQQPSLF